MGDHCGDDFLFLHGCDMEMWLKCKKMSYLSLRYVDF